MILTVTPNPALDVTYDVERLVPHASHRVLRVRERAGGKGVNVASVLALLGEPVLAAGLVGGTGGEQLRADLDRRGIRHDLHPGALPTRRTVTVEGGAAYNRPIAGWQLTATVDGSICNTLDRIDRRANTQLLVDAADAGTLDIFGPLPALPNPGTDIAKTRNTGVSSLVTMSGQAFRLPAGEGPERKAAVCCGRRIAPVAGGLPVCGIGVFYHLHIGGEPAAAIYPAQEAGNGPLRGAGIVRQQV